MPEVARAGEEHRHAACVGSGDHLGIARAAAGLDHRGRAGVGGLFQPVGEREERIAAEDRAAKRNADERPGAKQENQPRCV